MITAETLKNSNYMNDKHYAREDYERVSAALNARGIEMEDLVTLFAGDRSREYDILICFK
jgi:hypothetical protein